MTCNLRSFTYKCLISLYRQSPFAVMEAILNHARSYFQNPTGKNRNANIRLGFMTWMLNSMIALNFSFGIMLSSSSLSGPPLKCHNSPPSEEEICMSNTHFRYVFQAQTEDVTFSFFKLTHWIFFVWGKMKKLYLFVAFLSISSIYLP